jgi:hypothetical protein
MLSVEECIIINYNYFKKTINNLHSKINLNCEIRSLQRFFMIHFISYHKLYI